MGIPPVAEGPLSRGKSDFLHVGIIVGPHGLQGWIKAKLFSEEKDYKGFWVSREKGEPSPCSQEPIWFDVSAGKPGGKGVFLFRLKGVDTRDQAESFQGAFLWRCRKDLPPLPEEEFLHEDLIGARGETSQGTFLGTVVAVYNFGAGDLLEFLTPEKTRVLVPFTKEAIPFIHVKEGRIQVDWPLFETEEGDKSS